MATREEIFRNIVLSREKANRKHGSDRSSWLENPYRAVTILTEEVGEIAEAVIENDYVGVHDEIYDIIQVCVAWLEMLPDLGVIDA